MPTQIEQYDEFASVPPVKQKNKSSKRGSLTNFSTAAETTETASNNKLRRNSMDNTTPVTNKVVVADFDPRSPSNGIQRTPICYINEANDKKKMPMIDPRSPTNEYNRTPIHCQSKSANKNYNNDNLNSSLFNDSIISNDALSDSSLLLQQVPGDTAPLSNINNNNESPSKQQVAYPKYKNSNNPSHILQRKQVQKLKQNKLSDQDKENPI